jgi:hypothetical protein
MKKSEKLLLNTDQFAILKSIYLQVVALGGGDIKDGH